jgi:hypothetical protein
MQLVEIAAKTDVTIFNILLLFFRGQERLSCQSNQGRKNDYPTYPPHLIRSRCIS